MNTLFWAHKTLGFMTKLSYAIKNMFPPWKTKMRAISMHGGMQYCAEKIDASF